VIDVRRAGLTTILLTAVTAGLSAQQAAPSAGQPPATPPVAAATPPAIPGTVMCPAPAPPATLPARSFTAPAGMLLQPVMSTKVADFEKFLGYVRDALATTTDATVRKQAEGWKFFKIAETGPNGDVLFAFFFEPAVTCVDYALQPILAAAIPDAAKLTEVWNLYKLSVRGGGTLMNLIPITVSPTGSTPADAPTTQKPSPAQTPPLDANPIRPPTQPKGRP
jgi:hypothetical protein